MNNKIKVSVSYRVFTVCNNLFMVLLCLVMALPVLHIIAKSFSSKSAVVNGLVMLWPVDLNFDNYQSLFNSGTLPRSFMITVCVTIVGTALNLFFTAMMAYPLAKQDLRGRSIIMYLVVFTMVFSAPMIPRFLLIKELGLYDSYLSLIIPGLISSYNLILMRTFFMGLPPELFDAARIDGCSEFRALWRIALPLSLPVLVTVGLFYAVSHWNSYKDAMIYLKEPAKYTLQVVLREMISVGDMANATNSTTDMETLPESLKAAAVVFSTVPIMCIYPFLQKHFIKGALLGSVKG